MNPVFLIGDEIAFSTSIFPNTGTPFDITMEHLVTEFGFMVPLDNESFAVLDYLRRGAVGWSAAYPNYRALFIRTDGSLVDYTLTARRVTQEQLEKSSDLRKNEIVVKAHNFCDIFDEPMATIYGPGIRRAFGPNAGYENRATFALYIADDIPNVIDAYMKTAKNLTARYVSLKIPDVIAYLKEHKPSKAFNQSWIYPT